ncbi:MAG: hypothetical protein QNK37_16475 [Acidobacteriota bacterium]|nr:hypothetical protein [Acidobacteriota bacterium]
MRNYISTLRSEIRIPPGRPKTGSLFFQDTAELFPDSQGDESRLRDYNLQ